MGIHVCTRTSSKIYLHMYKSLHVQLHCTSWLVVTVTFYTLYPECNTNYETTCHKDLLPERGEREGERERKREREREGG